MTTVLTDANFAATVASGLTLVDFWAPWCGPCRMLTPVIDELSTEWAGRVQVTKMNVDENPDTPSTFGVRSIPALMLFKDGQLIDSKVGALPKASLKTWVEGFL